MEINGNIPPAATLGLSTLKNLQWKVGQILQAVVVKQLSEQLALLKINNQPVEAQTPQKLTAGTQLKLQVESLTDKPILKVLNQQLPTKAEPIITQAVKQALPIQNSILPLLANLSLISQNSNKLPIPPAIQVIAKELLSRLPNREQIQEAETVKQAVRNSGTFLENKLQKTADLLKQNMTSSDRPPLLSQPSEQTQKSATRIRSSAPVNSPKVFQQMLEKIAADSKQQPKQVKEIKDDVKGLLLRLLTVVNKQGNTTDKTPSGDAKPTTTAPTPTQTLLSGQQIQPPLNNKMPQAQKSEPPTLQNISNLLTLFQELGKQTESGLARTQLHQTSSLTTSDTGTLTWSLEIPIRNQDNIDIVHLIIEENEEKSGEKKQGKQWSVMLAVDLGELGPLHIKLQLLNDAISTTFWADKQDTAQLVNQNLAELKQRYESVGIETGDLHCYNAPPPVNPQRPVPMVMLDINA